MPCVRRFYRRRSAEAALVVYAYVFKSCHVNVQVGFILLTPMQIPLSPHPIGFPPSPVRSTRLFPATGLHYFHLSPLCSRLTPGRLAGLASSWTRASLRR